MAKQHKHQRMVFHFGLSAIFFVLTYTLAQHSTVLAVTDPNVLVGTMRYSGFGTFFLNLPLGTPPQKLPLLLDVQSSSTNLFCSNADLNSSSSSASFQPSLSSSFNPSPVGTCNYVSPGSSSPPSPSQICSCTQDTVSLYIERTAFPDPLLSANVTGVNFTCCTGLEGSIAGGAAGIAGLSRGDRSLPAQISKRGGLAREFSYCLPSVAFFGRVTSYGMLSAFVGQMVTFSTTLQTRLYYVKEGGYAFKLLNVSVLGEGLMERPTKMRLSTLQRYTTLERKVYKKVRASFRQAVGYANKTVRRPATAPFDTCFDTTALYNAARAPHLKGPGLGFQVEGGGGWSLLPHNTFVSVNVDSVACLGLLPAAPGQPSVLGTFQQVDCLAEFDLQHSRFGFRPLFDPNTIHPETASCSDLQYPMYPSS
ncbi:hypothetical protein L7F22_053494 [Adiantum nelumboides]|nr:hypothetical protein [Adiantum nelumboides]